MENNSKVLAMTMFCVLTIAVASNASSGVKQRALAGEDKGDGKPNETEKVASSPPPISPTIENVASSPPPSQSLPNSDKSDSSSSKSSPLMDSSNKTVPPPGPENLNPGVSKQGKDDTSLTPPTNGEHKATESAKKEGDKTVQSPRKEDHTAPQDPEKRGDTTSQAPTKDNVPSEESKNESCETANASNIKCRKGVLVACLLQSDVGELRPISSIFNWGINIHTI